MEIKTFRTLRSEEELFKDLSQAYSSSFNRISEQNFHKMLLYNITFNVENTLHDQWLKWMKANFVPAVMATKLPKKSLVLKLLTELDNGGTTYSFQFFFNEMEDYMSYEMNFRASIYDDLAKSFAGKYVMFSTLLEEI